PPPPGLGGFFGGPREEPAGPGRRPPAGIAASRSCRRVRSGEPPAQAARRIAAPVCGGARRSDRQLLQHRPPGGDLLVRAVRAAGPARRDALRRLDVGMDRGRSARGCDRACGLSLGYVFPGNTSCVWVTIAASLPSARVMRVCHTMVLRRRCSGVVSVRTASPTAQAGEKCVLLSIVAVASPVVEFA